MTRISLVLCVALLALACRIAPMPGRSYDEVRAIVAGKTAAEVERILGPPNKREQLLLGDERWTWWNYTYLGGEKYPPEVRGKVVHLEITFEGVPAAGQKSGSNCQWRVSEPYGVGFSIPGAVDGYRSSPLTRWAPGDVWATPERKPPMIGPTPEDHARWAWQAR